MWLVVELSSSPRQIAMLPEILGQGHPLTVGWQIAKPVQIPVNPGSRRAQACHNRSPGRTAQGRRAMGLIKKYPPFCQGIDIRRLRLRVPPKASHPVIQVVNCKKQNVWLLPCG